MKKLMITLMALIGLVAGGSVASASSGWGVSANTTKQNYSYSTDTEVVVAVKNDNSYPAGANLTAQQYVNGKWVDLDWNSPNPLEPEQKDYDQTDLSYFYGKKGMFRFAVDVDRYDSVTGDWLFYYGTFYTDVFYIRS
jgi:hypothetical protein